MNETEARIFREAYEAAVKRYSKMARVALATEEAALMRDQGMEHIYGGPSSKDELLTSILNLRGYTNEKLYEATHVVSHDVVWPDCRYCQAELAEA